MNEIVLMNKWSRIFMYLSQILQNTCYSSCIRLLNNLLCLLNLDNESKYIGSCLPTGVIVASMGFG